MRNEDIILILSKLDLSEKEASIYLALLELGSGSMSDIARHSKTKWTLTHSLVENMVMVGLIQVSRGASNRRIFNAVHPRRLLQIAELNKRRVEDVYEDLVLRYKDPDDKPSVIFREGEEGIKTAYEELLERHKRPGELLWIADMEPVQESYGTMLQKYIQELYKGSKLKVRELLIDNPAGREYARKAEKTRHRGTVIKFLPADFKHIQGEQGIIDNKIYEFIISKNNSVLITESKEIADSRRQMFEFIWNSID